MDNIFNISYYFFSIFVVVIIIVLAYYATFFVAKKSNSLLKNRHAKVLEKTTIGLNLNVIVIQINNKVYILVQHYKDIELLDVIDHEEWNSFKQSNLDTNINFNDIGINGLNNIKRMIFPKRNDIKGENDKNWNEK